MVVGDKGDVAYQGGPTLAAPPGEPSGPSPSVKEAALAAVNSFHRAGTSSSEKIASTGQTGSQAPQSTHSSGWM